MTDRVDDVRRRVPDRVPDRWASNAAAIRIDLERLHERWVALAFPSTLRADHSVIERRRPGTRLADAAYRLWAALGVSLVALSYPLVVVGLASRYYARRLDRVSASIGLAGVVAASLLAWGALTVATYLAPIAAEGVVAVAVAGAVATGSAVLARYCARLDGRAATVALGYPFGMTALFLPPVVASLYSPTLASVVHPGSETLAIWILDTLLSVGGVAAFVRATFELEGLAYVGMWFGLAVPTGWAIGGLVALAEAVRPSDRPDPFAEPGR